MDNKRDDQEFKIKEKEHSLCQTKRCKGIRLSKKDFGDGKHCSKCIKKIRSE